jgi:predicted nucleotidyltransferase
MGICLFVYNQIMERKLESLLKILHQQIPVLAERYSVETLEVFGSYVRDEQNQDSDLDVLVTFKEDPSLLTYIAIENHLSDLLGVKVDLVMKDSLKPKIGEQILSEAIPV